MAEGKKSLIYLIYSDLTDAVSGIGKKTFLGRPEPVGSDVANFIVVDIPTEIRSRIKGSYDMSYDTICMHEFVMTLEHLKHETGVSAMDVAKRLLDFGMHPPTMYFPLIVHEALMVEPTETESKETLDEAAEVFLSILEEAKNDPESLHAAPHSCPIGRPDEVTAARNPILRYEF